MRKYPLETFQEDLEKIRQMDIPHKEKVDKGEALAYLYYHQDSDCIDPFAITDHRENILK